MKALILVIASIFLIQSSFADDVSATKKCEDFLPAQTCTDFRYVARLLKEQASVIQDAVKAAIAAHKTKAAQMVTFIKEYIAERIQCTNVLPDTLCKQMLAVGQTVKLTTLQVKLAIEDAIAKGANTTQEIYKKAIDFMKTEITCEKIFGQQACDNIREAMKKFGEQVQLLNEAIISAAQKHITTVTELLKQVKTTLVEKIVNFKCEDVLPADRCTFINDLATKLHLTAQQVRIAVETAVMNGAKTATDIYNQVIEFLTTKINCVTILGQQACDNLEQARQKLHEQANLIKEAIMAAYVKQVTTAAEVLKKVKETLVEKAKNFKCQNVLSDSQCALIKKIASHFKETAAQINKAIVQAIVDGGASAKQIYDATIGHLIEDAKSLRCEDMINKTYCDVLHAFAHNFNLKVSEVTMAVKVAIANGREQITDIITFAKEYLVEKLSCERFLSKNVCDGFESLANRLHISFQKVIEKIRSLVAVGTNVATIPFRVTRYIWDLFFGRIYKRSADDSAFNVIVDGIMKYVDKVIRVGGAAHARMKVEINKAFEIGRLRLANIRQFIKELIEKYGPKSDEALSVFRRSITDDIIAALRKAHGKAKGVIAKIVEMLKAQSEQIKAYIKSQLKKTGADSDSVDDEFEAAHELLEKMAYQDVDDEVFNAEKKVEQMVTDHMY